MIIEAEEAKYVAHHIAVECSPKEREECVYSQVSATTNHIAVITRPLHPTPTDATMDVLVCEFDVTGRYLDFWVKERRSTSIQGLTDAEVQKVFYKSLHQANELFFAICEQKREAFGDLVALSVAADARFIATVAVNNASPIMPGLWFLTAEISTTSGELVEYDSFPFTSGTTFQQSLPRAVHAAKAMFEKARGRGAKPAPHTWNRFRPLTHRAG